MSNPPIFTIGQHSQAGRKDSNEDSYGILIPDGPSLDTKGIAMVIADGMSACEAGKEASENCVKVFLNDYYGTHDSWTVKTSVWRVVSALNQWLYGQGHARQLAGGGMVSTFSAMVVKSATAHIFHVGDTRIYRLSGKDIEQLTTDHRVQGGGGQDYLGRAMGIDLNVDIDYRSLSADAGDVFLFTTDGVHDYLRDSDMAALIREHGDDLDGAAQAIVEAAFENNSLDNLTCQIVRIDDPGTEDEDAQGRRLQALPFPPADLGPGMVLDGYRILRELHASNRTQVYLALDEDSQSQVVLKTPSVNFEDEPSYLEMFTREEWIGKRLSSPHILKVRDPARKRTFLYYVVEYVEGPTLRQWMHDNPAPELSVVRGIADQIAKGLRAFHRNEMIHQDLKPENIVIDKHGTVKIIDFGSAKVAGLDELSLPVEAKGPCGTVGYTAPEYLLGYAGTNRSDLFALGVIAYEMLTGRLPYGEGFSSRRTVQRLSYTSAIRHNPDIPPWVDAALAKAVHKEPARRYEVQTEFLADLSRPNPDFAKEGIPPLIERNPVAFWKSLTLVLFVLNLVLLFALSN